MVTLIISTGPLHYVSVDPHFAQGALFGPLALDHNRNPPPPILAHLPLQNTRIHACEIIIRHISSGIASSNSNGVAATSSNNIWSDWNSRSGNMPNLKPLSHLNLIIFFVHWYWFTLAQSETTQHDNSRSPTAGWSLTPPAPPEEAHSMESNHWFHLCFRRATQGASTRSTYIPSSPFAKHGVANAEEQIKKGSCDRANPESTPCLVLSPVHPRVKINELPAADSKRKDCDIEPEDLKEASRKKGRSKGKALL
ncbi:hypothetical protein FRC11_008216 [Ceratobasidium sp. 423]|nr:hypothetical protein FRC11_008216 [Ceratobasidium sp. 423]